MSIIEYCKKNNIKYSTDGSVYGSSKVLTDDNTFYISQLDEDDGNDYWEITFSKPVKIGSYIITDKSTSSKHMTIWDISISSDGRNNVYAQTDTASTLYQNIQRFPLKKTVTCKKFTIYGSLCNDYSDDVIFTFFDCFEPTTKNKCTCKLSMLKAKLIARLASVIYTIVISK